MAPPLQVPLSCADPLSMDEDEPRACTNNQCGEEMFLLAGVYLCETCDMVPNPANVEE